MDKYEHFAQVLVAQDLLQVDVAHNAMEHVVAVINTVGEHGVLGTSTSTGPCVSCTKVVTKTFYFCSKCKESDGTIWGEVCNSCNYFNSLNTVNSSVCSLCNGSGKGKIACSHGYIDNTRHCTHGKKVQHD